MNVQCPLCECLLDENGPVKLEKYDGLFYHADCLYSEMPELEQESVTTVAPSSEEINNG